jgi:16S rRNA (guanine527-N7)-methyltransferase
MPGADEGAHSPALLDELLLEARALGFLGPGPLEPQVRHAEGFATIGRQLSSVGPARVVDLGSGGGLPGLVVATEWPDVRLELLEANGRRAAFLRRAVQGLDLQHRVTVVEARAEVYGRQAGARAGFDGALARSFGRPAVVAECAAPLLKVGGWLLVSEPPRNQDQHDDEKQRDAERWPPGPLRQLGLRPAELVQEGFGYRVLLQAAECPERFPRRDGVPAKKPLF